MPPKTHAKAISAKTVPSICKSGAINESNFTVVNNRKHCLKIVYKKIQTRTLGNLSEKHNMQSRSFLM